MPSYAHELVRNHVLLLGLALVTAVVLAHRRAPWWWLALLSAWPVFAWLQLLRALLSLTSFDSHDVSLVRGVVATVAAIALLRERLAPPRFPAHRRMLFAVLGICGMLGLASFYNLGQKQFRNEETRKRTFIHYLDHRQYYTTAKYFQELGYRGIYRADVAAYLEEPGASRADVERLPIRDLDTHRMSVVGQQWIEIDVVKGRFSPERWQSYRHDARYFRQVMGQEQYFHFMVDFGGNATPVWMALASALYNLAPASDAWLLVTALLDPLLLSLAFAAIGWCYGLRTMLVCMVAFGANDFIMYGSNWAGATLRHDWLAYLALGACALKRGYPATGGALLGLAVTIRAFPALAVAGLALPALWDVFERWRATRRLPSLAELHRENRALVRAVVGAAVVVAGSVLATALLFSVGAWVDWWSKVTLLAAEPHGNHIGLRSLIGGWEANQAQVLRGRWPLYLAAMALYVALVVAACRGTRLDQAAILSLILVPVLFYPANYYIHFVFLLPLVMTETPDGVADPWIPLSVLGLCAAQYFTVPVMPYGQHFYLATVLLFVALGALLIGVVHADARAGRWEAESRWLRMA